MARCRQASAAAAVTAIDAFLHECSEIGTRGHSLDKAAIVAATAKSVSAFWTNSESSASAFVSEAAAVLPSQGRDNTTQAIKSIYSERASSISRYFANSSLDRVERQIRAQIERGGPSVKVAQPPGTPAVPMTVRIAATRNATQDKTTRTVRPVRCVTRKLAARNSRPSAINSG
jgi:hypothetical protein